MKMYEKSGHGTLRCYALGHCYDERQGCIRCGFPDYAEEDFPCWDLFGRYASFAWRLRERFKLPRVKRYCDDPTCGKLEQFLWWRVGNHNKCEPLPF